MFSCKIASRLISDSIDRPLSPWERCSLRFHLFICTYCRRFRHQARFLQDLGEHEMSVLEGVLAGEKLSGPARERIRQAIDHETGDHEKG